MDLQIVGKNPTKEQNKVGIQSKDKTKEPIIVQVKNDKKKDKKMKQVDIFRNKKEPYVQKDIQKQEIQEFKKEKKLNDEQYVFEKLGINYEVKEFDDLKDKVMENQIQVNVADEIMDECGSRLNNIQQKRNQILSEQVRQEQQRVDEAQQRQEYLDNLYGIKKQTKPFAVQARQKIEAQKYIVQQNNEPEIFNEEINERMGDEEIDVRASYVQSYLSNKEEFHPPIPQCEHTIDVNHDRIADLQYQYNHKNELLNQKKQELERLKQRKNPQLSRAQQEYKKFEREFKSYQNKRKNEDKVKRLANSFSKKDFEVYQATSPDVRNVSKSVNKSLDRGLDQSNKQDIAQVQKFFNKVEKLEQSKSWLKEGQQVIQNKLSNQQIYKNLMKSQYLLDLFKINISTLVNDINNFPTANQGYMSLEELTKFCKATHKQRNKSIQFQQSHNKSLKSQKSIKSKASEKIQDFEKSDINQLKPQHIYLFQQHFADLDPNQDQVVDTKKFISALKNDAKIQSLLSMPAVNLTEINKNISLDNILLTIEKQEINNEYITFKKFIDYFNNYPDYMNKDTFQIQKNNFIQKIQDDNYSEEVSIQQEEVVEKVEEVKTIEQEIDDLRNEQETYQMDLEQILMDIEQDPKNKNLKRQQKQFEKQIKEIDLQIDNLLKEQNLQLEMDKLKNEQEMRLQKDIPVSTARSVKENTNTQVIYNEPKQTYLQQKVSKLNNELELFVQRDEIDQEEHVKDLTDQQINKRIEEILLHKWLLYQEQLAEDLRTSLDHKFYSQIQNIFKSLPKYQNIYVKTQDFVDQIYTQNLYPRCQDQVVRKRYNFEETLQEVLERIENSSMEYIDWNEWNKYISNAGFQGYKFEETHNTEQVKTEHKGIVQHNINELDGYDSDPEIQVFKNRKNSLIKTKHEKKDIKNKKKKKAVKFNDDDSDNIDSYCSDPCDGKKGSNHSAVVRIKAQRVPIFEDMQELGEHYSKSKKNSNPQLIQSQVPLSQSITNSQHNQSVNLNQSLNYSQQYDNINENDIQQTNYMSQLKQRATSQPKQKLTKPQPYKFDERERKRAQTPNIRQIKVQEMIQQSLDEETYNLQVRFRPKEVPDNVKNKHLWDQIKDKQNKRREMVHQKGVEITLQNEKPFSFYYRDGLNKKPEIRKDEIVGPGDYKLKSFTDKYDWTKGKRVKRKSQQERDNFIFKANKVPYNCKVPLLDKINEDQQIKRKEQIEQRKEWMAKNSKLPNRMFLHEQEEKMKPKKKKEKKETFKAKEIPDFEKLQMDFQNKLQNKKNEFISTQPVEFNFQQTRGEPLDLKYMDAENYYIKQQRQEKTDKIAEVRKLRNQKPLYVPQSTKKQEAIVALRQKQQIEKENKRLKKQKEDEQRIVQQNRLKGRVQNSEAITEFNNKRKQDKDKKEEHLRQFKDEWKTKDKDYREQQERNLDFADRPLLVERPTKRVEQLEKMRVLEKMERILKAQGIKDYKSMFTREELKLLEQVKFIRQRGFAKDLDILNKEEIDREIEIKQSLDKIEKIERNNRKLATLSQIGQEMNKIQSIEKKEEEDEYGDDKFED